MSMSEPTEVTTLLSSDPSLKLAPTSAGSRLGQLVVDT